MEEAGRGETAIVRECQEVLLCSKEQMCIQIPKGHPERPPILQCNVAESANFATSIKRNILMGISKLYFLISGRKRIVGVKSRAHN